MYPSDLPPGHEEHWRKIISVYPPVSVETMIGTLGGGYPGMPTPYPTTREVRVNTEKRRIEVWERTVRPKPLELGALNPQPSVKAYPGSAQMVDIRGASDGAFS